MPALAAPARTTLTPSIATAPFYLAAHGAHPTGVPPRHRLVTVTLPRRQMYRCRFRRILPALRRPSSPAPRYSPLRHHIRCLGILRRCNGMHCHWRNDVACAMPFPCPLQCAPPSPPAPPVARAVVPVCAAPRLHRRWFHCRSPLRHMPHGPAWLRPCAPATSRTQSPERVRRTSPTSCRASGAPLAGPPFRSRSPLRHVWRLPQHAHPALVRPLPAARPALPRAHALVLLPSQSRHPLQPSLAQSPPIPPCHRRMPDHPLLSRHHVPQVLLPLELRPAPPLLVASGLPQGGALPQSRSPACDSSRPGMLPLRLIGTSFAFP